MLLGLNAAQIPDVGFSREQLQPLTNFRQQHRTTLDGRLCAAAFVQDRKTFTGPTSLKYLTLRGFAVIARLHLVAKPIG